ncbi:hypothetical protein [Paenibacillus oleatilyticus]|uniref:hypothetical protein n=1 Tax=Paenibacillus oleatilyticus TaxID=2594886 RepID=UPI001C1F7EDE|nr:hypothetical protein [Paenibacillus oleatilyticus]MBU7320310.1 hypothetical protein [Paenibacillus oleatilyticus]
MDKHLKGEVQNEIDEQRIREIVREEIKKAVEELATSKTLDLNLMGKEERGLEERKKETAVVTAISSNNLDTKDLHCISKHLFSFYEDAKNKETADFGKPCIDCKFALDKTCSLDWFPTFQRLSILTGVGFSMRKDRLEPVSIMDIAHRNPSDYN